MDNIKRIQICEIPFKCVCFNIKTVAFVLDIIGMLSIFHISHDLYRTRKKNNLDINNFYCPTFICFDLLWIVSFNIGDVEGL
jgi:hypothetical protein